MRGPLRLEADRGYDNGAVLGGLDRYVAAWVEQITPLVSDSATLKRIGRMAEAFAGYEQATQARRRKLVEAACELLATIGKATRARACPPVPPTWDAPLTALKGIGPARAEVFVAAGIRTIGQLLSFYPLRYLDRPRLHEPEELREGVEAFLRVRITGPGKNFYRGRVKMTTVPAVALDPTDRAEKLAVKLRWFGQTYRATQFASGTELFVAVRPRRHNDTTYLVVSECERAADAAGEPGLGIGRLVPVYSAIEGVSAPALRRLIRRALDVCGDIPELLVPAELAATHGLMPLREAIAQTHFPDSHESYRAARQRLSYQELLLLQLELALRRAEIGADASGIGLDVTEEALASYLRALPFEPTAAQRRVLGEVAADLIGAGRAHRLIHGDVGSGKTIVAAWALWAATCAGRQAALMAPTELLAEQHHRTLSALLGPLGAAPLLLTGSMPEADKQRVRQQLGSPRPAIVVGTHALFQQGVEFSDLAVVVIDEQHRFGLQQRAALAGKGTRPDVFVMSATPIPRTLALTLYGDYDISVIDELPPGRSPVATSIVPQSGRDEALVLLASELREGRQAYVVCPLIEEGDNSDWEAAVEVHESLSRELARHGAGGARLGLVHGRMPAETRAAVMEQYRAGQLDALVSTTVVEVGVDVPNATAMVVLNAERFGLAQLHQLRGRVARSAHQARCVLVTGSQNDEVLERLGVLEQTSDGFIIAEEDLKRRGPGELAGLAQHGLPDLHMATLMADTPTLVAAREDARRLLEADADLRLRRHRPLRRALAAMRAGAEAGGTI